jgi:hypothetical protein
VSRSTQHIRKQPTTDRNYAFRGGKHQGHTIAELLDADPQYLLWLHHNTDFELSAALLEEAEAQSSEWKP